MTLQELSREYRADARRLQMTLKELRAACRETDDPAEKFRLERRIAVLREMHTEMNALAEHTERYYERGYYRGRFGI